MKPEPHAFPVGSAIEFIVETAHAQRFTITTAAGTDITVVLHPGATLRTGATKEQLTIAFTEDEPDYAGLTVIKNSEA